MLALAYNINNGQSLACSPRGIAVTPLANKWKKTAYWSPHKAQYWSPQDLAVTPPSKRSETADRRGVYIFAPLKLRGYWVKVHQICIECCQIMAAKCFEIGIAIFHKTYCPWGRHMACELKIMQNNQNCTQLSTTSIQSKQTIGLDNFILKIEVFVLFCSWITILNKYLEQSILLYIDRPSSAAKNRVKAIKSKFMESPQQQSI